MGRTIAVASGVHISGGTLLEDVFTGGFGVADDAPTIGLVWDSSRSVFGF